MSATPTSTAPPGAPTSAGAQIHDLGYEPYQGSRSSPWVRTWIIARETFRMGWKSKWLKRCMWTGFMIASGFAFAVYFSMQKQAAQLSSRAPGLLPKQDLWVLWCVTRGLVFTGVLAATIVGGAAISDDLRAGAFQFYFARPLRPTQYALGKLLGVAMATGIVIAVPAVSLAILRVSLESGFSNMAHAFPVIWKTVALVSLTTATVAALACLISSLTPRRIYAQAGFAAIYFLPFMMEVPLAALFKTANAKVVSLRAAVEGVGHGMFGRWRFGGTPLDWHRGLTMLLIVLVGGVLLLWRRVAKIEVSALGT